MIAAFTDVWNRAMYVSTRHITYPGYRWWSEHIWIHGPLVVTLTQHSPGKPWFPVCPSHWHTWGHSPSMKPSIGLYMSFMFKPYNGCQELVWCLNIAQNAAFLLCPRAWWLAGLALPYCLLGEHAFHSSLVWGCPMLSIYVINSYTKKHFVVDWGNAVPS